MIKIFIGYDKSESSAFYVLSHSLHRQASMPVSITPLNRDNLRGIFTRERGELESTDFSISRFLVPYLSHYEGWSVFMDCDMVCRDDIAKLWAWRDDKYSVMCVHHKYYIPEEDTKFLNQTQTKYERKNWSSVILFNNAKCKALTPEYVNTASGLDLHQFTWAEEIGHIPNHWNHLVDVDKHKDASLIHYTNGGPWFKDYANCGFHQEWHKEKSLMLYSAETDEKLKIIK